jgi:hypothetical protein
MNSLPSQRQELILKWLQEKESLTIDELSQHFSVSIMTIHRDLDNLTQAGLVEKVHGGVMLAKSRADTALCCDMCAMSVSPRTSFVIRLISGETLQACCPHCGLMMMSGQTIKSALTPDFIYNRMNNVLQAFYVIESRVMLCCSPSVICFANHEDALSFQVGFGGQVAPYPEARELLLAKHHCMHTD